MIPYIENYENPQIGDFFMVKSALMRVEGFDDVWYPVFSDKHRDGRYGLDEPHYHFDWRFMPERNILDQRKVFARHYPGNWNNAINTEYLAPLNCKFVVEEGYKKMQYLRDFDYPKEKGAQFSELQGIMKNTKMEGMKCPHHGTNLVSCKPIDGVVTCPQHGLKWNIKTGELVL